MILLCIFAMILAVVHLMIVGDEALNGRINNRSLLMVMVFVYILWSLSVIMPLTKNSNYEEAPIKVESVKK